MLRDGFVEETTVGKAETWRPVTAACITGR
jgi:hypothetical protein